MVVITPESLDIASLPSLPLSDRRRLPDVSAVYLVLEEEIVIYVGQSRSLLNRWLSHDKLKKFKSRVTPLRVAWLECSEITLLHEIETALIAWFEPELNQISAGKKIKRERIPSGALRHKVGELIKARKLTYSKFARASGIGMQTAKQLYEDPCYLLKPVTLEKCCIFFNVKPGDILEIDKAYLK